MEWRLINVMAIKAIWVAFLFHVVQNFIFIQNIMNYFTFYNNQSYSRILIGSRL